MLLSPFNVSKGSNKHDELPEIPFLQELSVSNVESCCLLPSIKEGCLSSEEQEEIDLALKSYLSSSYERSLLLSHYSSAVKYNGEMYGSLNSLYFS